MLEGLDTGTLVTILLVGGGMLVASTLYIRGANASQDVTIGEHEVRLDNHDTQLKELKRQDGKLDTIIRILEEKKKGGTP